MRTTTCQYLLSSWFVGAVIGVGAAAPCGCADQDDGTEDTREDALSLGDAHADGLGDSYGDSLPQGCPSEQPVSDSPCSLPSEVVCEVRCKFVARCQKESRTWTLMTGGCDY